ncbi:hypothetical protein LTR78_005849 [Recurvomyces mirabilis]|uniref:Uncharacterized protein n=1 Tax=Recurvomyces mirabilis TaxID=574656 RepID=A0AAE1C1D8_9PEZI|nr:hypothetical protein LTR78_005849 [Recurvomyces mirabilis]KAK5154230.1 hypothetical protein LTS14_006915 [Recurvomyces mirabilis]
MVYRGCRSCAKRHEKCPGYRDPNESIFCDQTAHTILRSKKTNLMINQATFGRSMSDDTALFCFFELCARPAPSSSRSMIAYESLKNKPLVASMRALGLAARSQMDCSAGLADRAGSHYLSAIQATSKALTSPILARADETLLSVIILTFYEARCGWDRDSVECWNQHATGCAALIEARGGAQLKRQDGRLLFLETTAVIIPNACRLSLPVPQIMLEMMYKICDPSMQQSEPQWIIIYGWMRTTNLRSAVAKGEAGDAAAIVKQAIAIDKSISHAFDKARFEWTYDTLPATVEDFDNMDAAPIFTHWHRNALAAEMWESLFSCRLLLHAIMCKASTTDSISQAWLAPELHEQATASRNLISSLCDDILASVPQFCCSVSTPPPTNPQPSQDLKFSSKRPGRPPLPDDDMCTFVPLRSDRLPVLVTSQGYSMIWALNLVAVLAPNGKAYRKLACRMLDKLGKATGIRQAGVVADKYRTEGT